MMPTRRHRLALVLRRLLAASEARIQYALNQFGKFVPEAEIRKLADLDPSGGEFLLWLVRQAKLKQISGSIQSDNYYFKIWLERFLDWKKHPAQAKQRGIPIDINQYATFHQLISVLEKYSFDTPTSRRQRENDAKKNGAKIVYDKPPYTILKIGGEDADLEQASAAACLYAKGTKWCTSNPETARSYLIRDPLYIIFQNGKKVAQTDGDALVDLADNDINAGRVKKLVLILISLKIVPVGGDLYNSLIEWLPVEKQRLLLNPVLRDPVLLLDYLHQSGIRASFLQENPIALRTVFKNLQSGKWGLFQKFIDNVQNRFTPAQIKKIAIHPEAAAWFYGERKRLGKSNPEEAAYNQTIFDPDGRWRLAEPAIFRDNRSTMYYSMDSGYPDLETLKKRVWGDPEGMSILARYMMNERWKEAEPLMKGTDYWWRYAQQFGLNYTHEDINAN